MFKSYFVTSTKQLIYYKFCNTKRKGKDHLRKRHDHLMAFCTELVEPPGRKSFFIFFSCCCCSRIDFRSISLHLLIPTVQINPAPTKQSRRRTLGPAGPAAASSIVIFSNRPQGIRLQCDLQSSYNGFRVLLSIVSFGIRFCTRESGSGAFLSFSFSFYYFTAHSQTTSRFLRIKRRLSLPQRSLRPLYD